MYSDFKNLVLKFVQFCNGRSIFSGPDAGLTVMFILAITEQVMLKSASTSDFEGEF
jgi:hypothetical protein